MTPYKTSRRSGAAPTMSYVQRLIRDAVADGSQLKLFEMEEKGYVIYHPNGTYQLTDEGRRFLMGGRQ